MGDKKNRGESGKPAHQKRQEKPTHNALSPKNKSPHPKGSEKLYCSGSQKGLRGNLTPKTPEELYCKKRDIFIDHP